MQRSHSKMLPSDHASSNNRVDFFGAPIQAKFTPLNRVPFGKFNRAGGPRQWANPKLFE
jgi:hypothetical protein